MNIGSVIPSSTQSDYKSWWIWIDEREYFYATYRGDNSKPYSSLQPVIIHKAIEEIVVPAFLPLDPLFPEENLTKFFKLALLQ